MKIVKRFLAAVLIACLATGFAGINAFAKEVTEYIDTDAEDSRYGVVYYAKQCTEDAGRTDFAGMAMAGRSYNGVYRMAGSLVLMINMRSGRVTISTKDYRTGAAIPALSGSADNGILLETPYSSPISVFACTEATNKSGVYVCKYPTALNW